MVGQAEDFRTEWKRSLLDDATLHDVTFVGQSGWVVGEHGVIRRTTDGGRSWTLDQPPRSAALRSVCFLTNKIGWIAGGYVEPYTQARRGVLFFTNNGGETWNDLTTSDLPYLHRVSFFSLEQGVLVGEKMGAYGSGILVTEDGGLSWLDMSSEGEVTSAWRAGDFLSPSRGVVAGRYGQLTSWGGGPLSGQQQLSLGRRHLHSVRLAHNGTGWLVGDQAQLMRTEDTGVSWQTPSGKLPPHLRDFVDFYAVAQRGDHVWIAGQPGSVIWHSPDAGQTWQRQLTQQSAPLRAIHFRDDHHGYAVGDFGSLLTTSDGGATWSHVQGDPSDEQRCC